MTSVKVSMVGRWWAIVAAFAGGLLLAAAIRFGIFENAAQELMCRQGGVSGWCSVRSALGWSIHYQLVGLTGLFLALAGWFPGLRWAVFPALLLAGCGLFIYNATFAAVAAVVALLAALQTPSRPK